MIAGNGPSPKLVNALVMRLPDTSLTHALASGGREHFGWGMERHMLATIYDALNANTRATGNWGKKKAPDIPLWPRPEGKQEKKKLSSVAAIYSMFNRR